MATRAGPVQLEMVSTTVTLAPFCVARLGRAMQNALRSFSEAGLFYSGLIAVRYVYLLESRSHPAKRYVGITEDLKKRLSEHNAGKSPHTSKYAPWCCPVAVRFADHGKARAFEKYLKSGSGYAFAKRHFW